MLGRKERRQPELFVAGSLRDVILAAPPGSIITFQSGLAGTLNVASTLTVTQPVEILGPGADVIRVSGQFGDFPVFTIGNGATATIIERLDPEKVGA